MDAEGGSYSPVRAFGVQPAGRNASQPLFVRNPRCRVLSARFRRVVCEHLGGRECEALGLRPLRGRGPQQVSANVAHPRGHGEPEPAPEDEHDGQSRGPHVVANGDADLCSALLDAMQREMPDSA